MRKLLILILFITGTCQAQTPLSDSRHTSAFRYVYSISNEEALAITKKGIRPAKAETYLHTLVDSFDIKTTVPQLAAGNYLLVYALENSLNLELYPVNNCRIKIINNYRDLAVVVHDSSGQLIPGAKLKLGKKALSFDAATQTYRLNKFKRGGLLCAAYNGVTSFQRVTNNNRNNRLNLWQKIKWSFPLKYITKIFQRKNKYRYRYGYFTRSVKYQQKFNAYFVYSKPKYKPNDTVRFKAFITDKKGKPVNRPLLLRLTDRNFEVDTIIATIQPYRPGGFDGELVLNDSLDIDLDENYLLTLEELKSRKYDLDEYEGDLDDEEYAMKRLILAKGTFLFEEYELEQISFKARADKTENSPGNIVSIFAKATDENDLPVGDGRLQLMVLRNNVSKCYVPQLFIPDTLWQHNQPLDPAGETKIQLPDSIFPKADFGYTVYVKFLNSNNEAQEERIYQQYNFNPQQIIFKAKNDSLLITYQHQGKEQNEKATVTLYSADNKQMQKMELQLPATVWQHPFAESYRVKTQNTENTYHAQRKGGAVSIFTNRTKDSVTVSTSNPKKLKFWYTLLAGNKVIQKGYTDDLTVARKTITRKNYFLLLQYVWGDQVQTEDYYIPNFCKTLTIEVQQPATVYPGQQQEITISVKDAEGKPVPDADVTAWAFTKKFENAATPSIPNMSRFYPGMKRKANYRLWPGNTTSGAVLLNWQRWSREMGLDSIEYFKFLHPDKVYQSAELVADSLTQLAPFVVKNGNLQPIHLLYIDEKPVFFSQAEQLKRYSFMVKPGKHSLRLRTHNRMIRIDDVQVQAGMKNFISIEADSANSRIKMELLPDTLTNYEKELWTKYMIVVQNNFNEDFASIQQGENLYLLPHNYNGYSPNSYRYNSPYDMMVGPLPNTYAKLRVKTQFEQEFTTEPNYSYHIEKGLIKQKSLPVKYPFRSYLSDNKPQYNFKDLVLTEAQIDSLWQNYLDERAAREQLYNNTQVYNGAQLTIKVDTLENGKEPFVKSVFLFRYDNPDFVRIYTGIERNLGNLQPGMYKLMLLFKNGLYAVYENVPVKAGGYNYFSTGLVLQLPGDSVSIKMNAAVDEWKRAGYYSSNYNDARSIKETFNQQYFNADALTSRVSGRVTNKKGEPIGYVAVKVKGLPRGVITDANGYFNISTPPVCTLEFSSVGFEYTQKEVSGNGTVNITLYEATSALNEVVVVGYGTTRKRDMVMSMASVNTENMLMGKVAGVQITSAGGKLGAATTIRLRGVNSVSELKSPMYILDGEVFDGNIADIDTDKLESIDVLKDAAATALYGAAAANGVIVLTTKKGKAMMLDSVAATASDLPNTLRRNFKDDGFWQPRLRTNEKGKAAFTVTFPDDITKWRTFYVAMNGKKQSGMTELSIRSFKPLSANLALPQFLVQGDSINLIGKALNYNNDTALATRKFFVNGQLFNQQPISIVNARIDTFGLKVQNDDSLKLKYTIEQSSGYFDGEERNIPVFVKGVKETDGMFAVLDADTSFTIRPFKKDAAITLYAEASVLPVLLDEIDKVKHYEYLCNEQLASKLKALLAEKKIRSQLKQPFKEEKNIETIIAKLTQTRGRNFMWGWWADNDPSIWITLHVTEALLQAEALGYTINLAKQPIIDYIVYNQERFYREDKVRSLLLLNRLQAKADFKKYADSIDAHIKLPTMYQKLQWMDAKLQLGLPVKTDSVLLWPSRTMFGNLYWGEDGYRFFDNSVQNTLLAYSILRRQGGHEQELKKIRYYFLEKRKSGQWRNTYESALILETILPDLLAETAASNPPAFSISGTKNMTVTSFPFTLQATAADSFTITKKAGLPVYFTAYQQYHNPAPQKVNSDFEVSTVFENNGKALSRLKAGEAVILKTTVHVKADADYVMVEIPIPAGCSYKSKQQGYANNEVHREHFKNKVSLFCTSLKKGNYTFTVELLPRYNGLYNLNPAKAEMMYFPVFYGREGMKQVVIE